MLKLPKCLESEPRLGELTALLEQDMRPLWSQGTLAVPHISFHEPLARSLAFSRRCGKLRGGLENIQTLLQREEAGLVALRQRGVASSQGGAAPEVARISRLILLSNDGSERFNRACESMLVRYKDRLLGCIVNVNSSVFGSRFFGSDAAVKIVMVDHRDNVSKVLLSLVEPESSKNS